MDGFERFEEFRDLARYVATYTKDSDSEIEVKKFEYNDNDDCNIIQNYQSSLKVILNRTLYQNDWLIAPEKPSPLYSLIYLCCEHVIRDADYLKKVINFIPSNRCDILMKMAICNEDYHQSAVVLMSQWPSKSITASAIDSIDLLRRVARSDCSKNSSAVLAGRLMLLWRLFFDALRDQSLLTLRVLDLRGVPLGDAMVDFLIRQIINISNDVSLKEDYRIIIDCAICSTWTVKKLTSFLIKVTDNPDKFKLKLRINAIDVHKLDDIHCWTLLQSIEGNNLNGLRVNSNFSPDFYQFVFKKFSTLSNLDLSTTMSIILPFNLLPNLRRLRIRCKKYNLSTLIPTYILRNLHYLKLSGHSDDIFARIIEDDFRYLTSIPLVLREVDLSLRVMMMDHLYLWRIFLRSLAPTLTILHLNGCLEDDDLYPSLFTFVVPLVNLTYLSFSAPLFDTIILFENIDKLSVLPKLKTVQLSGIYECNFCRLISSPRITKMLIEKYWSFRGMVWGD